MSEEKRKLPRFVPYVFVGLIAAIASVLMFAGAQYVYQSFKGKEVAGVLDNPAQADSKTQSSNGDSGTSQLRKTSESFRNVAKKVGPAVVNITATKGAPKKKNKFSLKGKRQQPDEDEFGGSPFGNDPFFDFFERFGMPHGMPQQEGPQKSLGSGVIVDKKGIIVTNNHVVEGATEIMIRLSDNKTEFKAKIVGTDPKTDLAVLRVEGQKDLPYAEFGDSDTAEVGDWAIAIGSPFALDQSVTVGIVSAKGRNSVGLGTEYGGDLIQTDAAINPGNSGGPLCDLDGKVIGINTAIYTRSGGYMGIGFAIPSNLVKDIQSKLVADGKITRGWLGVYIQPLDAELAKEMGIKDGVGIREVIESSPAAEAGIQGGDIIVEVDGKEVKDVNQLQNRISSFKPGDKVKLKLLNYGDKKSRTVTVKIGVVPDEPDKLAKQGGSTKEEEPDKLGLVVSAAKGKDGGVTVDAIQPGSIAEQMLGIEAGDVIVRINRQQVNSVATYKKLVSSSKRIYMEAKRKGRTIFFQFVLPE